MMHVIAHHRIADPGRFAALAEEPIPDRPPHWRLVAFAPTRDGSACFSLWWADSAEALGRFLRRAAGGAGSVECHEVDEENAMGLAAEPVTLIHLPGSPFPPALGAVPSSYFRGSRP
jgi:hypothetical protein